MRDRKAYWREYSRKNAAKRKENLRRWAAANREKVNAYARAWKAKKRAEQGFAPPKPRVKKAVTTKPVVVMVPRDPVNDTLKSRFALYRKLRNQAA